MQPGAREGSEIGESGAPGCLALPLGGFGLMSMLMMHEERD